MTEKRWVRDLHLEASQLLTDTSVNTMTECDVTKRPPGEVKFRTARPTILRRLGWSEFTDERVAMIQDVRHRQISALLLGQ
ncbi:MAG: hypothetical protein ACREU6_10215 [Steroidobacteraceae bacterium]